MIGYVIITESVSRSWKMLPSTIFHAPKSKWETTMRIQTVEWLAAFLGGAGILAAVVKPDDPLLTLLDGLALLCGVGGILGSALFVAIWTPKTHREALCIFIANPIAAYCYGPPIIHYFQVGTSGGFAIGISSVIGMCATAILKPIGPVLVTKTVAAMMSIDMRSIVARVFGLKVDTPDKGGSVHDESDGPDEP